MATTKKSTTAKKTAPKTERDTGKNAPRQARPAGKASPRAKVNKKAANEEEIDMIIPEKKQRDPDSLLHQFLPCIYVICALLLGVFLAVPATEAGAVGGIIRSVVYGLFGYGAWLIPIFLVVVAIMWKKAVSEDHITALFTFSLSSVVILSALLHAIVVSDGDITFNVVRLFDTTDGISMGGAVGGFLANLLMASIQKIATYILLVFTGAILVMFTFGITPKTIILYIRYKRALARQRAAEEAAAREEEMRRRGEEIEIYKGAPASGGAQDDGKAKKKKGRGALLEDDDLPRGKDDAGHDGEGSKTDDGGIKINMFAPGDDEDDAGTAGASGDDDHHDPILDDVTGGLDSDDGEERRKVSIPAEAGSLPDITVDDGTVSGVEVVDGDGNGIGVNADAETFEATSTDIGEFGGERTVMPKETEIKPKKVYRFPPINMLAKAAPINEEGAQEELAQNAKKLVDTLLSFKVKTKILSVSRGPTITRYELSPEAGTRVRSIANLVDDIALNLATSGVRIEAPIPGKSAVGIEVPNKTVATVRLRELIEAPAFKNAESKLNVALGVDVAGAPVYCNIAKMPHMLIAGATGMGKSVCINSIISSILYKASPDEVKLMLVDPKKVEFNIYNGLPHLLVPVVSDPQKAAGSLNWAVGEMERRFTLIDEVGVRDIGGYNEITKNDPDREPMPYVVIIIDELADLMMTAPDAVETSICRLAQKARAAGMHLVIGTQRPSVDVITGLIKANIPSRIAFTVASQVDSKTIIDIGGAEKLIGRGDMLYAPVGFMKPLRVQGAFVSDEEVRSITDFIRDDMGSTEYDSDIIDSIEREAERCAQKGKASFADVDDDDGEPTEKVDPKFRAALELAVNSGKISTSLLQRHLSIGYGRAAKIIDRMQALGYVSPPDGSKPREVLITKQMYMEMVINDEDI